MKKIGFLLFLTALVIGISISGAFSFGPGPKDLFNFGSFFQGEVGSGNVVTVKRDVADFNKIDVSGSLCCRSYARRCFQCGRDGRRQPDPVHSDRG